ncbi:28291_t:CDS:1, partial [Dentiscutata erythropus]
EKVTTANSKYRATELSYQPTNSDASVLIMYLEFLKTAIEASIEAKIIISRV